MRQVIVRGLDGRSLCIGVDRDSISGAELLSQVALRCGYRRGVVDNLVLLTGTSLVSPGSLLLPDAADDRFPSCHVTSRLPGGKGGFGSLLRGAATRAGQKKTTNFDACRDMSGRRLRHVNAEKKLRDWRHEAKERRLEKVAQDYIKKVAKERKRDDKSAETVRQLREQSAQTMDRVAEAVQTVLQRQTKRLAIADGKKSSAAVEDDQDGKKNKLMSLLEGVVEEEDEDDDDEDDDSSDEYSDSEMEDDEEEEEAREDNQRRRETGGQASGSASAAGPSTSNPTSSLQPGSSHPSSSHSRPSHSSAPSRPPLPPPGMPGPFGTRLPFPPPPPGTPQAAAAAAAAAAAGAGGRLGRGGPSAPQGLALQPQDLNSIVAMQVAAAVASGAGSGHRNLAALKASVAAAAAAGAAAGAAAAAAAKAAGAVPAASAASAAVLAGDRGRSADSAPAADNGGAHGGGGGAAAPSDRAVSGCLSSEADNERQQKAAGMVLGENGDVDWNLVSSAQDLEGLGLERLKSELRSKGLKCGGSLAERAARLFLLKGSRVEDLDPKHLAKPPAAAKGKGKGKAA